jgi:signal transduction histidine kinase
MHTVELYQRLQKQVRQALSLGTIAARIQEGHMTTEAILRAIMTGVTSSEGLGLSRAILLEVDENSRELKGLLGCGAITRDQAEADWMAMEGADLNTLLGWFKNGTGQGRAGTESEFNRCVREIRVPLEALSGPLSDWMRAGSVQVCHLRGDQLSVGPLGQFYGDAAHCAVAGVPLKAGEKVVGVLVVDNRFLLTERDFDAACAPILIAFAELAAMTIEGAHLRARLADERHLRDWRQASSRVAHVLKSRIFHIQTLARDAAASLARREVRTTAAYIEKLSSSLDDMSKVLLRIQNFSLSQSLQMGRVDLVEVTRLTVENSRRHLQSHVELEIPEAPVYVEGDASRMPDVFIDLLHNADRAMATAATENPTIRVSVRPETVYGCVCVYIEDNGPGVPENIRDSMYQPYVTNSDITNSDGTGLGLAIIKDLLDQHGATIAYSEVEGGSGARFTVRFRISAALDVEAIGPPPRSALRSNSGHQAGSSLEVD